MPEPEQKRTSSISFIDYLSHFLKKEDSSDVLKTASLSTLGVGSFVAAIVATAGTGAIVESLSIIVGLVAALVTSGMKFWLDYRDRVEGDED